MSKYAVIALLVIGVAVVVYTNGCDGVSERVGVAKDKAIEQIDKLLGEINVKQKKVQNAYDELDEMLEGIHEKRIEAQVRVKNFDGKMTSLEEAKAKLLGDLKTIQPLLKQAEESESGTVDRNGTKLTAEQLKSIAERLISNVKATKDKMAKNKPIAAAWAKNLQVLKKQEDVGTAQLKKLQSQLEQIASKKSALDGMKQAASIGSPSESISDKFNELTSEVEELMVDLDTKFEIESAKLDERAAEMEDDLEIDLDKILNDKTDVSGTLNEIDDLLKDD